jgi:nitrogen regulatory protein P-II 1
VKKIEAIINPSKLTKVRDALVESGHGAMTISEVKGCGRQVQKPEMYRGIEYTVGFIPRVKVEVIVRDDEADEMVSLACRVARSGKVGDGKVLVTPIEDVVRLRTGEDGEKAV